MFWIVIVIVVGVIVAAMMAIGIYNNLVSLRNRYKNAFAQVDVQLKRRYDLIPNLVETAKGYMKHERETLEAVVQARNQAYQAERKTASDPSDPNAMRSLQHAETELGGALSRLLAVAEAYPDLKANQNMMSLQEELSSTENKVAFARQAFNDAVMRYNTGREKFPAVMLASALGFTEAQLFEVESPKERAAPKVEF